METIKVINKETKVVKEIPKSLVDDYLQTKEYDIYHEEKKIEPKLNEISRN